MKPGAVTFSLSPPSNIGTDLPFLFNLFQVPRLGLRGICLQDGPLGVRPARRVSQFPAGVTIAATFDRDLIAKRADAIAEEFKDKGVNIWLGPVTGGPLGRSPRGGRNWEGE